MKTNRLFKLPDNLIEVDDKYTKKVNVPQYKPSSKCPELFELMDKTQYIKLITEIHKTNIPDDVKEFLLLGATRHIVFNYSKIADYYAHALPEVQRLMEQSALVIIDVDDAIANGYVRFSENLRRIMEESGKETIK